VPVDALGRCQAKARRAPWLKFCGGNGVGRVRVQGLRAPAPFGQGEQLSTQAPPEAGSAIHHAAEAIRDSLDEFGFTRAPVTRVAHHLA
jgi:hypothetical protein